MVRVGYGFRQGVLQVDLANGGALHARAQQLEAKPKATEFCIRDIVVSRNGRWGIKVVDGNLYRVEMADGKEKQLTFDAVPDYVYGLVPHSDLRSLSKRLAGTPLLPSACGRRMETSS